MEREIRLENVVVVCNIHVLFNPNRGEIKLGQVRHLLEKAHSLSIEWEGAPIILAGDFNSVPQSPLYQFLKNGMLDLRNCNRRSISGQAEGSVKVQETVHRGQIYSDSFLIPQTHRITEETYIFQWTLEELIKATAVPNESLMRHSLNLRSAYPSIQGSEETRGTSNEPIITTYHRNFMGTVDYIWYTNGLSAVRVLEVLPISILQRTHGLPSKKWGSDHMTIACEFAFI
ncbi:hypothetical protein KP509_25G003400 [Ceratopteris richardii]|uniref:Endonuclease/exonuclease/phosphatase domain-containing protein n=1 Tax=Ceratopteris richardii TaxID=49495 RepID=A0A8T2RMA0_CERRI|nr:hypothetical protein KP509_25G003400 [Ceratopteris richardii]